MDQPNPIEILRKYKVLVWPILEKNLVDVPFPETFQIPSKYESVHQQMWEIVKDYPKRQGKYLRPTLTQLTGLAMGAKEKDLLATAAAMQLSEEWILIHDDIEDDSPLRRGDLSLHKKYSMELAMNAGDHLHALMWKILINQKNYEILDEFTRILNRTVSGQAIEIYWTQQNKTDITDDDWFFICDGKVDYYTIAGPMRLGAILAGAKRIQLEKLAQFGVYMGRCFQLVDDLLDITSDFNGTKQLGNDVYEGKRSLILGHLLRTSKLDDNKKIINILSKTRDQKDESEVKWIIEKMNSYGSIDYAKKLATEYRDLAKDYFEKELKFLSEEPYRSEIITLMDFILNRNH